MPPVVTYTLNGTDGPSDVVRGGLFEGKSFFLVQRMPTRSRFVKDIEANGGSIVWLEAQADYIIADHMRKDAPDGSLSYTFIDTAIKNGELPPEDEHKAGRPQGSIRDAGSSIPTRASRTPYTLEDDRQLYAWVKDAEAKGAALKGNRIYMDLEAANPRHTWQSWRDHYNKVLAKRPPIMTDNPAPVANGHTAPDPSSVDAVPARNASSNSAPAVANTSPIAASTPVAATSTPANPRISTPASNDTTPASEVRGSNSSRGGHATARRTGVGSGPRYVKRANPETPANSQVPRRTSPLEVRETSENEDANAVVNHHDAVAHDKDAVMSTGNGLIHDDAVATAHDLDDPSNQAEDGAPVHEAQTTSGDAAPDVSQPEMEGFAGADFRTWLSSAEHIQETPVGKYNLAWEDLTKLFPGKTAHELRVYYETSVLPVYIEMQEEDKKVLEPVSAKKFKSIVRAFGTQGQPLHTPTKPSTTVSTTPAAPSTNGTSVVHTTYTETTSKVVSTVTKRARSESEEAQQSISKRPRVERRQSETSTRPEPEAEFPITETQNTIITISSDVTSDDDEEEDEGDRTLIPAAIDNIDDAVVNTSDNDDLVQLQLQLEMDRGDTPKLTVENLRRAEAESNPRTGSRAKDVEVDNENQDQGDFASYLSGIVEAAAERGQVSKGDFEALKQKQQQLDAMALEEDLASDYEVEQMEMDVEDSVEQVDQDVTKEQDDQQIGEDVVINDRRVSEQYTVDTQGVHQGLEDLDYSSPLREFSPDIAAPLNPDTSPSRASYQSSQLPFVVIPRIDDEDEDDDSSEDESESSDEDSDESEEDASARESSPDEAIDESLDVVPPEGGWEALPSPTTPRASAVAERQPSPSAPPPRWKGKGRATSDDLDLDIAPSHELSTSRKSPTPAAMTADAALEGQAESRPPSKAATPQPVSSPAVEATREPTEEPDSQVLDNHKLNAIMREYTQQRGLDAAQVIDAFNRTSMRLPLVYTVLNALVAGKTVPGNLAGVWSDAEDEWLESRDLVGLRRVRAKHGREECEARLQFLKDLRDEE